MDTNHLLQSRIDAPATSASWGLPIEQYHGPLLYSHALPVPPVPIRTRPVSRAITQCLPTHRVSMIVIAMVVFGLMLTMIGAPALGYHLTYLNSKQAELLNGQASISDDLLVMEEKMTATTRQDIALASQATQVSPSAADAVRYAKAVGSHTPQIYNVENSLEVYRWPKSPGQIVIGYSSCAQGSSYPASPNVGICTQPMTLTTAVNFTNPGKVKVTFSSQWRRSAGTIGHHSWDYQVRNRRYVIILGDEGDNLPSTPVPH